MVEIQGIKFPAITYAERGPVSFARNIDDLTICNSLGLKKGFYNNLEIVDIEGNYFKVIDAKKTGTIGGLFGYNIFLNQKLRVALNIDNKVSKIELIQFKEKTINAFKKDITFWDSDGNFDNKIRSIEKASS
ncbi:MAG: hypothetical protein ACKOE6_02225, partial [Flammeovirgaceae bacterium]